MHKSYIKQALCLTSAIALSATLPSITLAQNTDDEIVLPGIVVQAASLDSEGVPADKVGSAVTVITAKEIERQQAKHVSDVLRGLAGISVSRTGGAAGVTQIRMRGAEGNHTLVLIDGVEANNPTDGEFDFSNLSASEIERIEVIRGPQSGLYGSSALAGVISITTKKGRGPLTVTMKGEAGSFNTKSGTIRVSGGTKKVYGSLTIDKIKTDGFNISPEGNEKDGSDRTSIFLNAGFRPMENLTVDFMVRDVRKNGEFDNQTYGNPPKVVDESVSSFKHDQFLIGMKAKLETFSDRWVHELSINKQISERYSQSPDAFAVPPSISKSQNDAEAVTARYQNTIKFDTPSLANGKHSVTGLVEYKEEKFTTSGNNGEEHSRDRVSYASEYRGVFNDQLSLSAAIRHDENDTFEDFTTYRLSSSWEIPQSQFRLHSSVGTGVVFPTLYDQFGSISQFFRPNPDLKPEESFGWDAGVEWKSKDERVIVDLTYFNQDLKNEIKFAPFDPTGPSLTNENGISKRQGIELQIIGRISDNLLLTAAYTYLDAKNPDGTEEVRRAPHSAKLNVNYRFLEGKANLNLGVNYNGKMKDVAFPITPNPTLDDYVLVSLAGSYKVQPNIELFARVENLLDQDYEEIFGYETPGINAYAGVKIKLGPVND